MTFIAAVASLSLLLANFTTTKHSDGSNDSHSYLTCLRTCTTQTVTKGINKIVDLSENYSEMSELTHWWLLWRRHHHHRVQFCGTRTENGKTLWSQPSCVAPLAWNNDCVTTFCANLLAPSSWIIRSKIRNQLFLINHHHHHTRRRELCKKLNEKMR